MLPETIELLIEYLSLGRNMCSRTQTCVRVSEGFGDRRLRCSVTQRKGCSEEEEDVHELFLLMV